MQPQYERLSHCKWECKYHVVFIPKYRKKVLYGHVRKRVGQIEAADLAEGGGGAGRRSCNGRPRAHVFEHSAKVRRSFGGGVSEGEECGVDFPGV